MGWICIWVWGARPGGSETILLVEDSEALRDVTRTFPQISGCTVLEAENAGEAILLAEHHDGPIPMLITDVIMTGQSGSGMARPLTGKRQELNVLFVCGDPDSAIAEHGILEKGVAFLQKPYTRKVLAERVRQAIESS